MLCSVLGQALLDVCLASGTGKVDAAEAERSVKKMYVAIDEAGKNELPLGIDDFAVLCLQLANVHVGTDGDDTISANGDGLGPRLLRIERINSAVQNDSVGVGILFLRDQRTCVQKIRKQQCR